MASTTQKLTFDRNLRHAFAPLSGRLEMGIKSLDGVIEMLRLRIEAEAEFARSLENIISSNNFVSSTAENESLRRDGLDAICADMKNEYTQRIEFLNSLNEDVYQPCVQMRESYASQNRIFANSTKTNIKQLRQQQNQFYKIKTKYEKVCKEASSARTALLNAKLDNKISSAQILKLGTKVNSTLKTQQTWKEKYDQQQLIWNKHQIKFDDEMTSILQGMQTNEYNRMRTIKDSLNKWAVFITNLCANRNYDVKTLAESMALINIENDLQLFMTQTLKRYPPKNPNGPTPPHHSFHYGKSQQVAIQNLSKTSSDKPKTSKTSNSSKSKTKIYHNRNHHGSGNYYNQNHSSNSHNRAASLSLSSFISFDGSSQRKGSNSYSLSEANSIHQELAKKNMRQQSSPNNSISSFIKQKFQKQRSYNGASASSNRLNDAVVREDSNTREHTISSYHGSEVYPPMDDDTSPVKKLNLSPATPSNKGASVTPKASDNDPELPTMNMMANRSSLKIDLSSSTTSASAQIKSNSRMKKKKLNKPKKLKRKRHRSKQNSLIDQKQKQQNYKKTQSHPNLMQIDNSNKHSNNNNHNNSQNISLYTENHSHDHYLHRTHSHNQSQHPHHPSIPPPITTNNKISSSPTTSPKPEIKMNAQPQTTAIKKPKKSATPPNNAAIQQTQVPSTMTFHNADDDGIASGGSTPTLSEASDDNNLLITSPTNKRIFTFNINNNDEIRLSDDALIKSMSPINKKDTPVPENNKKAKLKQMVANMDFAAHNGAISESEDEIDPLD